MDLRTMAQFPFLGQSITHLREHPDEFADFQELARDITYERVRERAMERVMAALSRQDIRIDFFTEEESREELLSYILARILVAATGDGHLIRWYSLAEAVRARTLLMNSSMALVLEVGEDLDLHARISGESTVKIPFSDYLHHSANLKSLEWKLTNQALEEGFVQLDRKRIVRLIQEALRERFERDLLAMKIPDSLKQLFGEQLGVIMGMTAKLKDAYEAAEISVVVPGRFPPCIKNLLAMTREGKNVSHSGRFAMTSFLHRISMDKEEILDLFRVSPDFREDLARYQVEHIMGIISGTDYGSMACKTMITYGLCIGKDELCEKINHPLGYYEVMNDDALPRAERILRRSLVALREVARTLKVPMNIIQEGVMGWFGKKAVLRPGVTVDRKPGTILEGQDRGKEDGEGEKGKEEIDVGGDGKDEVSMEGKEEINVSMEEEMKDEVRKEGKKEINISMEEEMKVGINGKIEDEMEEELIVPEGGEQKEQKTSSGLFHYLENWLSDLPPVRYFDGLEQNVPQHLEARVSKAWMMGMKITHPGTLEDQYPVCTIGTLEDARGRIIRMLPVLDFDTGKILRDMARSDTVLDIYAQLCNFGRRRFIHVIEIKLQTSA